MTEMKHPILIPPTILAAILLVFFAFQKSSGKDKPIEVPFSFQQMQKPVFAKNICNIRDYGAINDGVTLNSQSFEKAIEDCSQKGGGTIVVGSGTWLTGAIHLKSNIELNLQDGARVLFSKNPEDYLPAVFTRFEGIELYNYSPFIYVRDAENIAITGTGTFDGQGESWMAWKKQELSAAKKLSKMAKSDVPVEQRVFATPKDALRPSFMQFVNCKNIWLEDFSITNSPMWTIHPIYSENININNVKLDTKGHNTDGIVIDSSKNVLIENSILSTGDDSIAIKSGLDEDGWRVNKPSENIIIRNSKISDGHSGVAIGSEMSGDVRNVMIHDLSIDNVDQGIRIKSILGRGGIVENIYVKNIAIGTAKNAAYQIDMNYDSATLKSTSKKEPILRNFYVDNMTAKETNNSIELEGLATSLITNAHFTNVTATSKKVIKVKYGKDIEFTNIKIKGIKKLPIFTISESQDIRY